MIAPPVIEERDGYFVARDDLLPGGTKMRLMLPYLAERHEMEFVYASPAYGYAQVALAHCTRMLNKKATIFTAKRKKPHELTLRAKAAGARIFMVPHGYLSNVQSKANKYCQDTGAKQLPFGANIPQAINFLVEDIKRVNFTPDIVWTVAGSGTLTRALQKVWPEAEFHAVIVGTESADIGRAKKYKAPEKFEQAARRPPPFPSSAWYDAKAWQFFKPVPDKKVLFWNVGA